MSPQLTPPFEEQPHDTSWIQENYNLHGFLNTWIWVVLVLNLLKLFNRLLHPILGQTHTHTHVNIYIYYYIFTIRHIAKQHESNHVIKHSSSDIWPNSTEFWPRIRAWRVGFPMEKWAPAPADRWCNHPGGAGFLPSTVCQYVPCFGTM